MQRIATVNYHVHKPYRQAFELDAGGILGNLVSPELAPTEVPLTDVRESEESVSFDQDGVQFANHPSEVTDFEAEDWKDVYDTEVKGHQQQTLGVRDVIVFDHTVRTDDPYAPRKPARNVHSDYSADGARNRLTDLLGAEQAEEWAAGHYAFVNPDRKGQIMGLVGNDQHKWIYKSRMTPDEVVMFNIFDSSGQPSVAHSALDMVEDPHVTTPRKSVESRTLVRN